MKKTLVLLVPLIIVLSGCTNTSSEQKETAPAAKPQNAVSTPAADNSLLWKPVIYLYPTTEQKINVTLGNSSNLKVTYPEYNNGWDVVAYPDGKIINLADNKEYSYLFWEGASDDQVYDLTTGFIVEGKNSSAFLQNTLGKIGLSPKEYNEFIVYWLPKMINNEYNLVHFATKEEYDDKISLNVNPKPDSMLRVFMVFKALDERAEIKAQNLTTFNRHGFSVIEWGGTEIK